jgi:hypothetical protein
LLWLSIFELRMFSPEVNYCAPQKAIAEEGSPAASSRARLREADERLNLTRVVNLAGCTPLPLMPTSA